MYGIRKNVIKSCRMTASNRFRAIMFNPANQIFALLVSIMLNQFISIIGPSKSPPQTNVLALKPRNVTKLCRSAAFYFFYHSYFSITVKETKFHISMFPLANAIVRRNGCDILSEKWRQCKTWWSSETEHHPMGGPLTWDQIQREIGIVSIPTVQPWENGEMIWPRVSNYLLFSRTVLSKEWTNQQT